jgi:hypothetical protein
MGSLLMRRRNCDGPSAAMCAALPSFRASEIVAPETGSSLRSGYLTRKRTLSDHEG